MRLLYSLLQPRYHDSMSQVLTGSTTSRTLRDSYGRAIRDLRVSVTDKCNFRCFYCLPHGSPPETAPKSSVLTYEEIEFAVSVFASLGVEKVRPTSGEPMLRRDIETLVAKLARVE